MIKVLNIIKEGNRIKYYDCVSDNDSRLQLSKDALLQFIRNKQCVNATMQVYNRKTIIRVKGSTKKIVSQSTQVQCNNENTILSYIDKARNKGFNSIKLDGIEVDTATLHIRKTDKKEEQSIINNKTINQNNVYTKLTDLYEKYFKLGIIDGKLALIKCKINQSVVNVPLGVSIIANSAFTGLDKIKTITLPLFCVTFQDGAFDGLESLENIIISETSQGDNTIEKVLPQDVKLEHYIRKNEQDNYSVTKNEVNKIDIAPKIQYSLLTEEIVWQIKKPKALKFQSNKNLETINSKAPLLGYTTTQLSNDFLLLENNTKLILVSNKQIQLGNTRYGNGSPIGLFQDTDFTSIDFQNTDTSNVTNMKCMFWNCQAQTLDLSSFDTSNVTDMESMFFRCQAQTLDLSSFDTSNVLNMQGMFEYCKAQIKATDTKIIKELQNR